MGEYSNIPDFGMTFERLADSDWEILALGQVGSGNLGL